MKKTLWMTRTAALLALLVMMQAVTSVFGNTILTGSIVNLILIVTTMTTGLTSGLAVAIISPIFAKFIGIGPLWELIPFIIIGNSVLVLIWHIIGNQVIKNRYLSYIIAMVISSICKYLALYIGIVKIAIPFILHLPEKQAMVISNMFSIPQLLTALIGGFLSTLVLPRLIKSSNHHSD